MNNQETAEVFAKNLKVTINTNESKTDQAGDKKIVSQKTRETNFKATMPIEDRKHTELKPATLKSTLRDRKKTAPGHDGLSYQLIKHLPLETLEKKSQLLPS